MSEKQNSTLFYGYIVAAAGFWIWFIGFGTIGTFGVFFVPVSAEFDWTRADTALASSLRSLTMGLMAFFMGWMTDKLGPRFVVVFFGSFLGIAFLFLSRTTTLWQFTLYHALISAIGMSTASVPIMATVSRWFARRRGLILGLVQSGVGLGGCIISPITGRLIIVYGWRTAYAVLGILALVGITASGLFLRRDPRDMGLLPDGAKEESALHNRKPGVESAAPALNIIQLFFTRQFWVLAGLYFAFGFCRSTFTTHIGPHVQDLGFTLAQAANVLAIINFSSIAGRIVMGRAADNMGVRRAMMIGYAATVVDMIWGLYTRSLWGLYLYAAIFGFGWGAQAVLRFPATVEVFGLRSAGLVMGIMGIFEHVVAASIGVWVAGYVFDLAGNYWPIYWAGLGIALGGVILANMVKQTGQEKTEYEPGKS
ncbi:MAG: MFS transporter [Desulfobacterales bacterium]|nr:MFS transporter [Desulfobacterales bacterium]